VKSTPRLFVLLPLLLAGCYTHYQPNTGSGGYSEQQIDQNTFRVTFQGNSSTPDAMAHRFELRRCAELTKSRGGDYFVLVDVDDSAEGGKPKAMAVIRIFQGPRPITEQYAYDAQEILDQTAP
jgi:hypothetical protein